jgi:hypothetical protein
MATSTCCKAEDGEDSKHIKRIQEQSRTPMATSCVIAHQPQYQPPRHTKVCGRVQGALVLASEMFAVRM